MQSRCVVSQGLTRRVSTEMPIMLPKPIAGYFAAENADDPEALALCFIDRAVVRDEGKTFEGVAAIKQWNIDAKKKYHHTVEPLDIVERDGKTVVIGKVSGDFPGSPINLEHIFELQGEEIASLEIS